MKKVDFDDGHIIKNILQTAFPMLLAQVLNLLYSIVDRIYIGRIKGAGADALGAVGLCFPMIMIIAGFTNMYGMGGAPLYAMELGRGNTKKADSIFQTAFRLLIVTAAVIMIAGELLSEPLLSLFGAAKSQLEAAGGYLRVYLAGTVFSMIATGLNPYLNAGGYALVGMLSVMLGAAANIILDPVFIFLLGMGVRGAALATVISQMLSAVFVMTFMLRGKNDFRPSFAWSFPYAKDIVSLGLSPFIMQFTNSMVQVACNTMLVRTGGALYVSVMTIVSSVRSILDTPVLAVTEGTSPVISYNYGAGRPKNVKKAIRMMIAMAVPYTALIWLLIMTVPRMFIGIFSNDPKIMSVAVRALHIYFFAFIFQALQYSGQTVFKALNKRRQVIFFSLLRKALLVVPLTCLLPTVFNMGTDGVFAAEPISNVIGGLACFITMLIMIRPELKEERYA